MLMILGGLIPTYVLSRLFLFLVRKAFSVRDVIQIAIAHSSSLVTATVIGGFGLSSGGEPLFIQALLTYIIPQMIWVIFDMYKLIKVLQK